MAGDGTDVFFATGNGTFDVNSGGSDYGDSIVKIGAPSNGTLPVLSYFTPWNQSTLNANDTDLGSGGVLLLPTQSGTYPNLLVQAGKDGIVHLVDADALGGYCSGCSTDVNIVQELPGAVGGIWGGPAFWNNNIYFGGKSDHVKAFSFNAPGSEPIAGPTSTSAVSIGQYGPTPSVSANGTSNGIVWIIQADAYNKGGPAVLRAFDANNLATELYNSNQNANDSPGGAVKFTVPTVANGKVYVGTSTQLSVYGLLGTVATPTFSPPAGVYVGTQSVTLADVTPGATIYYTTNGNTPTLNSKTYTGPITIRKTGTVNAIASAPGYQTSPVASETYTIH